VEVKTDSTTVCFRLRSLTECDRPVRTHGLGKALMRRRLALIANIAECGLKVKVSHVRSEKNKADRLMRVPPAWLRALSWRRVEVHPVLLSPALTCWLVAPRAW